MLVRVRLWQPRAFELGPTAEVALLRDATFQDLARRLAPLLAPKDAQAPPAGEAAAGAAGAAGPPADPSSLVSVVKPFAYLLKDLGNMGGLKWSPQPRPETRVDAAPLR